MNKSTLKVLGWVAVGILLFAFIAMYQRVQELRDNQNALLDNQQALRDSHKELRDNQNLLVSLLTKPEASELTDTPQTPKGLVGYKQLPPEQLPPAPV